MSNPMIRIHDLATNEIIDKEMTDAEYAKYQADLLPAPSTEDEQKAQADKAALLAKLGISADEAKLLLS